jgi:hypothetical protein
MSDKSVYECSLVYDIVNAIGLMKSMVGNLYPSILRDEIFMTNQVLREKFGRNFSEYSEEEVSNLVAEHILLNKEFENVR